MTKVRTKEGTEYEYIGTIYKNEDRVLELLAELKDLDCDPGLIALSMRMMMRKNKNDKV